MNSLPVGSGYFTFTGNDLSETIYWPPIISGAGATALIGSAVEFATSVAIEGIIVEVATVDDALIEIFDKNGTTSRMEINVEASAQTPFPIGFPGDGIYLPGGFSIACNEPWEIRVMFRVIRRSP